MTPEHLTIPESSDQCCAECAQPLNQGSSCRGSAAGELVCTECIELLEPAFEHYVPAA
ncbi:hypothetical protein AmyhaDRAFT_0036 [Haloechinothrix halophila YIM 93223]|uniref:ClpX-type ZB domain-containing protein n=1 Tax=Haloechinothrix halophila YIM 93223 TaxID=592678 RepID=W9DN31_9PSEU|nr:hypothetical protein AmyhaDRAFT_0036 [Haloechinothrix halophila YIM 93223]